MNITKILKKYKEKKSYVDTVLARIQMFNDLLKTTEEETFIFQPSRELGMPSTHRNISPVEKAIEAKEIKRDEFKELIKQESSRIFWKKLEVETIRLSLQSLTTEEMYIVECKYFENMTWRNIEIGFNRQFPQKNDITDERIKKMNSEAYAKICDILGPFYDTYKDIYLEAA